MDDDGRKAGGAGGPSPQEEWARLVFDQFVAIDRRKAAELGFLVGAFVGAMRSALNDAASSDRLAPRRNESCRGAEDLPEPADPELLKQQAEARVREIRQQRRRSG